MWERFVDLYKQLMLKTKTYDDLSASYLASGSDIQMKRCALDAFNETINMFRDQIMLQEKMQNEIQPHEIKRYVPIELIVELTILTQIECLRSVN